MVSSAFEQLQAKNIQKFYHCVSLCSAFLGWGSFMTACLTLQPLKGHWAIGQGIYASFSRTVLSLFLVALVSMNGTLWLNSSSGRNFRLALLYYEVFFWYLKPPAPQYPTQTQDPLPPLPSTIIISKLNWRYFHALQAFWTSFHIFFFRTNFYILPGPLSPNLSSWLFICFKLFLIMCLFCMFVCMGK